MLKIKYGEAIIDKGSKMCDLYIFEGFNDVVHSSSVSEDFHENNKPYDLRSRHVGCVKVILEYFNEFCRRKGIKMNLTTELSWSF